MKVLSKAIPILYLLLLLSVVLFKFPFHASVLSDSHTGLNLVPFADFTPDNVREMIDNFVIFVPFGLLLSANYKRGSFWRKLAFIFIFSCAVETIQFVFAIGVADITDVIMNTSGGFLGLLLYYLGNTHVDHEKLDRFITVAGAVLFIASALPLGILFSHSTGRHPGVKPERAMIFEEKKRTVQW